MQAVTSAAADSDEAAALAAMFQMQSANWEETQEKMSQSVPTLLVVAVVCLNNHFIHL